MNGAHYEINPLPQNRGWKLELFYADATPAGGGVFPVEHPGDEDESVWAWNDAYETAEHWLEGWLEPEDEEELEARPEPEDCKVGFLKMGLYGRYELNGEQLTCGDPVDVSLDGTSWVHTRMEAWRGRYYLVGVDEAPDGLLARFPG